MSLLQRGARAQCRNMSGARRKSGSLLRKIRGIRLKGCPAEAFDSRAGGSFTRGMRRFQQPARGKEGAGCRNKAELTSGKHLLAQPATLNRGRRHCQDGFRQGSGVVAHFARAYVRLPGTRCQARIPAGPPLLRRHHWRMAKEPASPIAEAGMAALNTTSGYRDRARTDREKIHARRKFVRRS